MGQRYEIDLLTIRHASLFEIDPHDAVDQPDGWKILDAGKANGLHVIEEFIENAEGIGAVDASEHGCPPHDRQDLVGHLHDNLIGIAIGQEA